ncbi:MAG: spermidine/putrescine transport system substrate-binding protein [Actinomycetota bacterium]|nr:spermidine/putrescine transport system substrate-binding protein [Actinomycetota bacterium]
MTRHPRERPTQLSRREFLRRSAGAAAALPTASALLAACAKPGTSHTTSGAFQLARPDHPVTLPLFDDNQAIKSGLQPEKNATLQIYNWDQYLWKKVVKGFCDKYNCDFEITTFNNMDEALSKIRTNQFNFDVFFPTIDVMGKLTGAKILQPLNHDYIPNLAANCWKVFQNPFYDQGWRYSVPYTVYTTGIEYRRDAIQDDVINGMSNPYEILWDPKYKGKVGIYDDYREAIGMALLKNGITDVNTSSASAINTAKKDLIDLISAVNVRATINGAYAKLPEGEFVLHQAWSGDAAAAWFYVPHYTQKYFKTIGYWYPKDRKGVIGNDLIGIPSRAKNPVLAHLFLNYILDFKNSMDNFSWVGYQPPQIKADPERLTKTTSAQGEVYVFPWLEQAVVKESDFPTGYELLELSPSTDNLWHNAWEEFKSGAKA